MAKEEASFLAADLLPSSSASRPVPRFASIKDRLVRPDVQWLHFGAFLVCALFTVAAFVFINAALGYILVDILDYDRAGLGRAHGTLVFADEALSVVMTGFWGILSDRVGRHWIFSTGFLIMAVATFFHPLARSVFPLSIMSFFTSLLFLRLLFALGGSAASSMLTAVIGDIASDSGRAKVAGTVGVFSGFGAMFAALFLSRLPVYIRNSSSWPVRNWSISASFFSTAALLLASTFIAVLFVRTPKRTKCPVMSFGQRLKLGIAAGKHPLVALAYFSGLVARADSIVLSIFLNPWITNYFTTNHLCPPPQDIYTQCPPVKRLLSTLLGVSHLFTLIAAPFFGIIADRLGVLVGVALPALLGVLSFGALFFVTDPRSTLMYLLMVMTGIADIGMIVSSSALIASQSHPDVRGSLAGLYSFFGALGIIITSQVGGFLFDRWHPTSPFLVVAIANVLFLSVAAVVLALRHRLPPSPFPSG